ncbi:thioesterase II family protein [Desulfopila sp. IMCC35008]|uniref:thioesterase II family protein n=1 Tax=Desulfopila sp. IMCC35008 TaxID=2653858 RepID=UPI0013D545A8|nr:alpha/beta fold hydrolase [Desulfopila sp. IMCC35008]
MKLIMLPYAGGSSHCYRDLTFHLADFIEPLPLELPGRGRRISEPLLTDINALVDDLFQRLTPTFSSAYAFYGHSMGALLCYLLSCKAVENGYPAPKHLFLSGHAGPESIKRDKLCHTLPKREFLQEVIQLGGTLPEVAASQDLLDFFEPILRADFAAIETFRPAPVRPLDVEITVMMGCEEESLRNGDLNWQKFVLGEPHLIQFDGDHFFLIKHWSAIGALISTTLDMVWEGQTISHKSTACYG